MYPRDRRRQQEAKFMRLPSLAFWLAALAVIGLLPPQFTWAAVPANVAPAPLMRDVALDADGAVVGTLGNNRGEPICGAEVLALSTTGGTLRTVTGPDGRFRFPPLPGGVYRFTAGGEEVAYRVWSRGTAQRGAGNMHRDAT